MNERETLADRIKRVRRLLGLSQDEMARELGISKRAYQNYEQGLRPPPSELLKEMGARYGIDPWWLLSGEGEPFLPEKRKHGTKIKDGLSPYLARWKGGKRQPHPPPPSVETVMAVTKAASRLGIPVSPEECERYASLVRQASEVIDVGPKDIDTLEALADLVLKIKHKGLKVKEDS